MKTASKLATTQGSTLINLGKIQLFLVPTRTMEQNKILNKSFKQTFHITDIKHNSIGIPFITKYIPTISILNSKIHDKDQNKQQIYMSDLEFKTIHNFFRITSSSIKYMKDSNCDIISLHVYNNSPYQITLPLGLLGYVKQTLQFHPQTK